MAQKYPIGMQRFREIREGGYVYVDKTEATHKLVTTGKYYFLSRPRRFGKSLLVDTIEELFSGSKELFEGLWIHDNWDWTKTNPVIHFDFSEIGIKTIGMEAALYGALADNAAKLGITLTKKGYDLQFKELIQKAAQNGPVVILIDEYDKPIIDFLDQPDQLDANRAVMQNFYSILKARGEEIRFLLITGVSQFSKVSIFSGLNNLRNITISNQYGGLVGITQQELEENFSEEIAELQKKEPDILSQIKDWYNGYTWNMLISVYNPFSLLNYMVDRAFHNYWFETGTSSFLLEQLKKHSIYDVDGIEMGRIALSTFNTDNPNPGSLLFQTGYLTIKNISADGQLYELGYPNREVKSALLDGLLDIYRQAPLEDSIALVTKIKKALNSCDIDGLVTQLNATIADIPYDYWKAETESIFTVITSLIFKKVDIDVYTEVHSSKGRCDVLVKTDKYIYVQELKLDGTAAEALAQNKEKGYLQPYVADPRKKMAIGISFSSETRKVEEKLVEEMTM